MTPVHGAVMIRPAGIGASTATAQPRAASRAGAFRIESSAASGAGAAAEPAPPTEILSALIDLQGVAGRDGERRRKIAAAQWTLSLLDRLRVSLLEGAASDADLDALQGATGALRASDLDDGLKAALDDLDLRARVELAKRGR